MPQSRGGGKAGGGTGDADPMQHAVNRRVAQARREAAAVFRTQRIDYVVVGEGQAGDGAGGVTARSRAGGSKVGNGASGGTAESGAGGGLARGGAGDIQAGGEAGVGQGYSG